MHKRGVSKSSWVFAVMANVDPVETRPHFHCKRCGERLATELPMRMEIFIAMGKAFIRLHRECR